MPSQEAAANTAVTNKKFAERGVFFCFFLCVYDSIVNMAEQKEAENESFEIYIRTNQKILLYQSTENHWRKGKFCNAMAPDRMWHIISTQCVTLT